MADHWKTLANRLGTPGIDEPEVDEIKDESPVPGASPTAAVPMYTEPVSKPLKSVGASAEALSGSSPQAPEAPESQLAPAKPAKRKSSWEALASLFNVSVDRSEPVAETPPPTPVQPQPEAPSASPKGPAPVRSESPFQSSKKLAEPAPKKELSIFDEPEHDPNTALDAMFGDAPREKLRSEGAGWGKPKRVVDDLGWDEVEDQPLRDEGSRDEGSRDEEAAFSDNEVASEGLEDDAEEVGDEPARRSRRRRRRGRRGRGRDEETVARDESLPDAVSEDDDSVDLPVSWKHDLIEVESAGPWAEPESFESDVFEAVDESVDEPLDDDSDDGVEVLRRSNRRRRRRGRTREDAPAADGTITPRDAAPRDAAPRDTAPRDSVARDSGPRRDVRSERGDAPREARRAEAGSSREPVARSEQPARSGGRDSSSRDTARDSRDRDNRARDSRDSDSRDRDNRDRDSRDRDSRERSGSRRDVPRSADVNVDRPRREAARPVESNLPVDEFDLDFVEPIDDLDEVVEEDRPVVAERSAGGRRRRGGRKPVDSPARSRPDDDEGLEEVVDEVLDEGDDEEGSSGAHKHRNIPTWSDSLESIIQANTENHKRNEGRGGPRGGNRPRGRR